MSKLVTVRHLGRKAVIYIRQSTLQQVLSNQESLRLQYALRQRAQDLGWHEADIEVIDTDLGRSGATTTQREGFKELIARVTLGEVAIIFSYDVPRLARNCSNWYPLMDLCGCRQCLIGDRDGVYDAGSANSRLLLGQGSQAVGTITKIPRPCRQQDMCACGNGDPAGEAEARTARKTAVSNSLSRPGVTRSTAPASWIPTIGGAQGVAAVSTGTASVMIGTKAGPQSLTVAPGSLLLPQRHA